MASVLRQRIADFWKTFSPESGKRVLNDLRKQFGNRQSFVPGDSHATAFREGQRSAYLYILDKVELAQDTDRLEEYLSQAEESGDDTEGS
ncbi:MAG: hypothetical protein ACRD1Z_10945 [Vicinamibacteria bacterium]